MTFAGSTGTLRLDHSSTFTGKIFKFGGNGSLSGSDHIDLRDVKYSSVHDSYANGVLTVTDGSGDTAKLSFNGSYTLANFKFANDGSGGTIVYDPPVRLVRPEPPTLARRADVCAVGNDCAGPDGTISRIYLALLLMYNLLLGYLPDRNQAGCMSVLPDGIDNANIALLGNYMASMFAMASDTHGGVTTLAEVAAVQ